MNSALQHLAVARSNNITKHDGLFAHYLRRVDNCIKAPEQTTCEPEARLVTSLAHREP